MVRKGRRCVCGVRIPPPDTGGMTGRVLRVLHEMHEKDAARVGRASHDDWYDSQPFVEEE